MVGKTFEKLDFGALAAAGEDFEDCTFMACDFSSADLSGILFSGCSFEACNLSLAVMRGTTLRDVIFRHCKLMGISFSDCSKFLMTPRFHHCMLHYASFTGLNLKKISFDHCDLKEADFSGADLSEAVFENCDLVGTLFSRTLLSNADFRSARYYSIDPEENRIRGARFTMPAVLGLLDKYGIRIDHTG